MRTRGKSAASNERVGIERNEMCQLVSYSIRAGFWNDLAILEVGHLFPCEYASFPEGAPAANHQNIRTGKGQDLARGLKVLGLDG